MKLLLSRALAFVFAAAFAVAPLYAQYNESMVALLEARALFEDGHNRGDRMTLIKARDAFERLAESPQYAVIGHYYAAVADYVALNVTDEVPSRLMHIQRALASLKQVTQLEPGFGEAYALQSSLTGQLINLDPARMRALAPSIPRLMQKAQQLAPGSGRVAMLAALNDFFIPEPFGGGRVRALQGLQHAAGLFARERHDDPMQPDWGHDDVYAWIGYAHQQAGRRAEARRAFEQALAVNPDNGWARLVLTTELEKANE